MVAVADLMRAQWLWGDETMGASCIIVVARLSKIHIPKSDLQIATANILQPHLVQISKYDAPSHLVMRIDQ